jgi:general secretion pathway protein D
MRAPMPSRKSIVVTSLFALLPLACFPTRARGQSVDSTRREVHVSAAQMGLVQASLAHLFQGRIASDPVNPNRLELRLNTGLVVVDTLFAQQRMVLQGPAALASDIANIVAAFALPTVEKTVRILPLNDNGQISLAKSVLLPSHGVAQTAQGTFSAPSFLGVQRTQFAAFQQDNDSAPATTVPSDPNTPNQTPSLPLQQFEGVQVEMLPEIDAIILRGRDQQLNDLAEIIKQLDEASRLIQPEVDVIPLKHVNSDSVAKLLVETQENLVGTRQGKVSVTSIQKPNAVLVIGWGEAIKAARELIAKLDQPVEPNSQFVMFQLEHAVASELQSQLNGFYASRAGLGPVIQSMVDERTNAIVVNASPRDVQEIRLMIEQLDVPRGARLQQARVFQIRNGLAADVADALTNALTAPTTGRGSSLQLLDQEGRPVVTSGILGNSQITVNERNNTIIAQSSPENLPLIEKLIEQLDTPGQIAKIKIFPVKNGDAGALVETLRALLPAQSPGAVSTPQISSSPDESALLPLRFTVDARGNNIIVVGSEGDLKIVEALIVRLDESDAMQRKSTVYQLKNSPAVDVALAINEFLRSKRVVENASPGTANPFEQLEKEVVVVPEPVQNKLILSATPRYYDEISRLIEQLDEQPPQVMIQVMIAEITLGDTDEFGTEFGLQSSVLFDRSLLGELLTRTNTITTSTPAGVVTDTTQEIVAASNTPGFNFNSGDLLGNSGSGRALSSAGQVGSQGISNFSVGRTNQELGFGGLVLSASSENVSFLLRALQDSRRLEILSRPQVLTLDNQQAFIQVGQRVPRIVSSIINQNGAQNNVALENIGLIIGVTPRISPDGNVVMEIDAEKSKLGPESEGIPVSISANGDVIRSPRVDTITAQATVSAADGETIILGGLISRSTRIEHRQVPWLGSIPVLKYLFSYDLNQLLRTELLIIMTPHVVRSQGDMERLKQAEFARMSWCEADVFDIHGDVYPPTNMSVEMMDREGWDTVYPDVEPRGRPETIIESPRYDFPPSNYLPGKSETIPPPVEGASTLEQVHQSKASGNLFNSLTPGVNFSGSAFPVVPASATFPLEPKLSGGRP